MPELGKAAVDTCHREPVDHSHIIFNILRPQLKLKAQSCRPSDIGMSLRLKSTQGMKRAV